MKINRGREMRRTAGVLLLLIGFLLGLLATVYAMWMAGRSMIVPSWVDEPEPATVGALWIFVAVGVGAFAGFLWRVGREFLGHEDTGTVADEDAWSLGNVLTHVVLGVLALAFYGAMIWVALRMFDLVPPLITERGL